MKFNKKPISVRAIFGTVLAALSLRSKRKQEQHEPVQQTDRTEIPRWRGSSGVNMSPHVMKMIAKRKVRRKTARKSRRVNRRVAQL